MRARATFRNVQDVKGNHLFAIHPGARLETFLPARGTVDLFGRHVSISICGMRFG
jgi:hypothetical protein